MNHWTLGNAIFVPPNSSTLEVDVSFQVEKHAENDM